MNKCNRKRHTHTENGIPSAVACKLILGERYASDSKHKATVMRTEIEILNHYGFQSSLVNGRFLPGHRQRKIKYKNNKIK